MRGVRTKRLTHAMNQAQAKALRGTLVQNHKTLYNE